MTVKDLKQLRAVINEEVTVIFQKELKPLEKRINDVESKLTAKIDEVEGKLSNRINDVEGRLGKRINEVEGKLSNRINDVEGRLGKKIDILWDQVIEITAGLDEVKEMLKNIDSKIDHNHEDIIKLEKRVRRVEATLGIAPPPELAIQ